MINGRVIHRSGVLMYNIQVECFLSLSKTLNFSETAKQLYISQQAVSKNIAKFEENLGFPLFRRTPHSVELTPWGERYLELVRNHLREEASILESYHQSDQNFRILTLNQPDFEPVRRMHPFTIPGTSYPANVELIYDTPAVEIERLLKRDADMVITIDRFVSENSGLIEEKIFPLEAAILISRNHPLYKEDAPYLTYYQEPFIAGVTSSNFFETRDSIMRDINNFGLAPRSLIIVPNADEALKLTARAEGIILGSVMSNPKYQNVIASVPTGVINHIVCVWNESSCKSYSMDFARFMKHEFEMAASDFDE